MRKYTAALVAGMAFTAATVGAVPAAFAGPQDGPEEKARTSTVIEGGKFYVRYEHRSSTFRPEDVTLRIHRVREAQVLASLRLTGTDACPAGSSCQGDTFLSEPVTLPDMRGYVVDVVAREGEPDEVVQGWTGFLNYGLDPRIRRLAANVPWVSYDIRGFGVDGTVVAEDPRTHEVKPFPDVYVAQRQPDPIGGGDRTDEQGHFEDPELGISEPRSVTIDYGFDDVHESITIGLHKQDLALKVDAPTAAVTAPYGSLIPVRGRVTRAGDSGVRPWSSAYVSVGGRNEWTGRDGTFASSYPVRKAGPVLIRPVADGFFNEPPSYTFTVNPVRSTVLTGVKAGIDKYGKITFTGTLGVNQGTYPAGTVARMRLQNSADGKTWHSSAFHDTAYGSSFKRTSTNSAAGPYWRLRLPYADVTSPVFTLKRTATKIVKDDITPEPVRKGATLTAQGALVQQSGAEWKAYAGQQVRVWFKADAAGSVWKQLGSTTTLRDGTFTRKFTAQQDGTWQVRYTDTDDEHLAASGVEDHVDVR